MENTSKEFYKNSKNYQFSQNMNNESAISGGSSQGKQRSRVSVNKQEEDEKTRTIKELRAELQKYKLRCV